MSLIADALQPHTVAALISLSGRPPTYGLSDLITNRGSAYDLDFNDTEESILVDFRDSRIVVPVLAADCCRFATCSFQSMAPVSAEIVEKGALAWSIVKIYYAAFYAGHSIIRMLGESCSFLEREHTGRLAAVANAMGKQPSFRIERGLYRCTANMPVNALRYVRAGGATGGSHESFWKVLHQIIHQLSESILVGDLIPAEAQAVFAQLQLLERNLNAPGRNIHSALSGVRNDLQYRQLFGAWFPVQIRKREREILSRIVEHWQDDPMNISLQIDPQHQLKSFAATCTFIVSLCRAMILRIAARSSEGARCFLCFGPLSYLRDAGLQTSAS